ncbi:V-type ATP synthase subunit D [Chlamydiales bacterium SCGC AB-751-O23]|jgi:V/A-type H+/Na+-transporting ATPase subunit D|nr:V-type ATP synthase subunit D [Chlamydiales bacterium SCGC AB-751-O23]
MAEIKLTKNELRSQQVKLSQLNKYLPTLQLKKAMLQSEVSDAKAQVEEFSQEFEREKHQVQGFSSLLSCTQDFNLSDIGRIKKVNKRFENIAGVEVPYLESIDFVSFEYQVYQAPVWLDAATEQIRKMVEGKVNILLAKDKLIALEKELREVSIRVNLFEKILIPRALGHIKKIKIFLGDQQLNAVSQAKKAKEKVMVRKAKVQVAEGGIL